MSAIVRQTKELKTVASQPSVNPTTYLNDGWTDADLVGQARLLTGDYSPEPADLS